MKERVYNSMKENTDIKHKGKIQRYRILSIDESIRNGVYPNSKTLAKDFEVNSRTILRDIEYMKNMYNAPIEYNAEKRGYYYSDTTFFIKSVFLSETEIFSLAVFQQIIAQYQNTPLEKTVNSVFSRLYDSLPEKVTIQSSFLRSKMSFIPEPLAMISPENFTTIFSSLKEQESVVFDYKPLKRTTWIRRIVDPYHVICSKGNWYFIGYCHYKKNIRMFSFSRIKEIEKTGDYFTIPVDFNPENYFDKEIGVWVSSAEDQLIELLFDKEVRSYALDYQWHSTQTVEERQDGTVYVSFITNQLNEVTRWILGQGHTVKVLAPELLRENILNEINIMKEKYENE